MVAHDPLGVIIGQRKMRLGQRAHDGVPVIEELAHEFSYPGQRGIAVLLKNRLKASTCSSYGAVRLPLRLGLACAVDRLYQAVEVLLELPPGLCHVLMVRVHQPLDLAGQMGLASQPV